MSREQAFHCPRIHTRIGSSSLSCHFNHIPQLHIWLLCASIPHRKPEINILISSEYPVLADNSSDDLIDTVYLVCVNKRSPLTSCPSDCAKTYQSTVKEVSKMLFFMHGLYAQRGMPEMGTIYCIELFESA